MRTERVGHVELGPDLHPPDQRGAGGGGEAHDFAQHAIDPVAHHHAALGGLGVNVARALADAVADHRVHQLRDRRVERGITAARLRRRRIHRLDPGRLQAAEDPLDGALGAVHLVQPRGQRGGRRDLEDHVPAGDEAERLLQVEVARIGRGDANDPVVGGDGNDLVLPGQRLGQQRDGAAVGGREIGSRYPIGARNCRDDRRVGHAVGYGGDPQRAAVPLGQTLGLTGREHAVRDQERSQPRIVGDGFLRARSALRINCHIGTLLACSLVTNGGRCRLIRAGVSACRIPGAPDQCAHPRWR